MDLFELAQLIHEDRLREAERARRYRQHLLDDFSPPVRKRPLLRLGNPLSALGNRLKAQAAMRARATTPANCLKLKGARYE